MPFYIRQCPLCKQTKFKPYATRIEQNSPHVLRVTCKNCGLIFSNPQATPEEFQHYYDKGIFSAWNWKSKF